MKLDTLKKKILEDGRFDQNEVKKLSKRIYADGVVDDLEKVFLRTLRKNAKSVSVNFAGLFKECCPGEV